MATLKRLDKRTEDILSDVVAIKIDLEAYKVRIGIIACGVSVFVTGLVGLLLKSI